MNWQKPMRRIAVRHYHQLMEELRLNDQESTYSFLTPKFAQLEASNGNEEWQNVLGIYSHRPGWIAVKCLHVLGTR